MTPEETILRRRQLPAITGLSLTSVDRLRLAGSFPPPVRLSPHAIGWHRSAVMAWLASRERLPS
jgi:prophage regulatory protein